MKTIIYILYYHFMILYKHYEAFFTRFSRMVQDGCGRNLIIYVNAPIF